MKAWTKARVASASEIGEQTAADLAGKKPARQTDEMCLAIVS